MAVSAWCRDETKYGVVDAVVKHFEAMAKRAEKVAGQPIRPPTPMNVLFGPTIMRPDHPEIKKDPERIKSIPKKDDIVGGYAKGPLLYRRFVGR